MTLPASGFSLQDVNAELRQTGLSLNECIDFVGNLLWDKLSDFGGYSAASITVSESSLYFSDNGFGIEYVVVTSEPYGWTVDYKPDWIDLTAFSGLSGTTSLGVSADLNLSDARSGFVRIRQNTSSKQVLINVYQEAGNSF